MSWHARTVILGRCVRMDRERLKFHIKLCKKNLKSNRVKCCATCPFEEEIVKEYPELKELFKRKQFYVLGHVNL